MPDQPGFLGCAQRDLEDPAGPHRGGQPGPHVDQDGVGEPAVVKARSSPPAAHFQRASNSNASTASRSDSPNRRCRTITVATICGGTLGRPRVENKSANSSSPNSDPPSACSTEKIDVSASLPSHTDPDPAHIDRADGVNPRLTETPPSACPQHPTPRERFSGSSAGFHTSHLADQWFELRAVGLVGVGSQALAAVGLVVAVAALEPAGLAVALEGQDVGGDPV